MTHKKIKNKAPMPLPFVQFGGVPQNEIWVATTNGIEKISFKRRINYVILPYQEPLPTKKK
jgi:hypothetical protein